jgi:hypothetical protein
MLKHFIFSRRYLPVETGERLVTSEYCNLSGATYSERSKLLAFTSGLVDDGIYDAFLSIHPLVGSTIANKAFNMLDPIDNSRAFKLLYTGTPLNHAKGLQWQSNQGATIELDPSLMSGIPNIGGGVYAQDTNLQYAYLRTGAAFNIGFNDGGKTYVSVFASATGIIHAAQTGLLYGWRQDASTVKSYRNDTERTSEASAFSSYTGASSITVYGQGNPLVSMYFILNRNLDATERANFSNRVNALMTALGRVV